MSQRYQKSSCWWEANREQGNRLLSVCCTGRDWKRRGAVGEATDEEVVCFPRRTCTCMHERTHTQTNTCSLKDFSSDIAMFYGISKGAGSLE